jgi:hypothetical protein
MHHGLYSSFPASAHRPRHYFEIRGAHLTVDRSGIRKMVGIRCISIFYTAHDDWHGGVHTGREFHQAAPPLTGWSRVTHDVLLIVLALFLFTTALPIMAAILGR